MEGHKIWLFSPAHGHLPAHCSADGTLSYCGNLQRSREGTLPSDLHREFGKAVEKAAVPRSLDESSSCEDMTALGEVSEAALLHNLYNRYAEQHVFTAVGSVLLSINPYKRVDGLFGAEQMRKHRGRNSLTPHLYATAEAAYSELCNSSRDQALVMSGESGAGKTEACKEAMRYLAEASDNGRGGRSGVPDDELWMGHSFRRWEEW